MEKTVATSCNNGITSEFTRIRVDVFNSDTLSDMVYKIYLALLTTEIVYGGGDVGCSIDDMEGFFGGFYLACVERVVLTGQVDLLNDRLPSYAGLVVTTKDKIYQFQSMRRIDKAPRHSPLPPRTVPYVGVIWRPENGKIIQIRDFLGIAPSGAVCFGSAYKSDRGVASTAYRWATTLNAWTDSEHLWRVETREKLLGGTYGSRVETPLIFGTDAEQIKSLFYARSLPVTETGRRRPILHWVQAHERRLKEGIEINIDKHLRGVTQFEMDAMRFVIKNPLKGQKEKPHEAQQSASRIQKRSVQDREGRLFPQGGGGNSRQPDARGVQSGQESQP